MFSNYRESYREKGITLVLQVTLVYRLAQLFLIEGISLTEQDTLCL